MAWAGGVVGPVSDLQNHGAGQIIYVYLYFQHCQNPCIKAVQTGGQYAQDCRFKSQRYEHFDLMKYMYIHACTCMYQVSKLHHVPIWFHIPVYPSICIYQYIQMYQVCSMYISCMYHMHMLYIQVSTCINHVHTCTYLDQYTTSYCAEIYHYVLQYTTMSFNIQLCQPLDSNVRCLCTSLDKAVHTAQVC